MHLILQEIHTEVEFVYKLSMQLTTPGVPFEHILLPLMSLDVEEINPENNFEVELELAVPPLNHVPEELFLI
jgi:hypothetical protein